MRYYLYKLYFRNGCTYVGKHTEKRDNDGYITSSSYYKKHKDLLERREILLEVKDLDTLDIMETICILADMAENKLNVNYNYGAWLDTGKFDRGFVGASNGMFGKRHTDLARAKMSAKWTNERKEKARKDIQDRREEVSERNKVMNSDPEHIKKCKETQHKNCVEHRRYKCVYEDLVVDFNTYTYILKRVADFKRVEDDTPLVGDINKWIETHKTGHGQASKGKHWYNNGVVETYAFECPEGFSKGRMKFSKEHIANIKAHASHKGCPGNIPWNKGKTGVQENHYTVSVRNIKTGAVYNSIKECCEKEHISKTFFYRYKGKIYERTAGN